MSNLRGTHLQKKSTNLLCGGNRAHSHRLRYARRQEVDDLQDGTNTWFTDRPIRWKLYGTIKGFDMSTMESIIVKALNKWAAVSSLTFEKAAEGADRDDIELKIEVSGPDVLDPDFPAQTDGSWIAANASWGPGISSRWVPVEKKVWTGYVKFNNTSTGPNNWNVNQIHNVFLHEVGHTLGLGHTLTENAIMARLMAGGGGNVDLDLKPEDITRIQKYYKPAGMRRVRRRNM
ncbi:hypothetical protein TWF106_011144 [Orbilia oligospora]|uniref:Peptidase metallopeptidase domain-containing protein n=1 Tax=Orbilia oligospora TaxID=2813651 RepID=A0A6G1MET0_ORBOL|nr:hypothetical protein TWF788_007795 [Orbilia oligospora]KAF3206819.1 hypothetical protein TWF679_008601 [Orbilia oligospora]KAF3208935.1 hypothetical protein TWF106_011144 [Orbilia oligospora]KAF3254947.1 hypothetical protein TWF192_003028 [Orbilia oligospora]